MISSARSRMPSSRWTLPWYHYGCPRVRSLSSPFPPPFFSERGQPLFYPFSISTCFAHLRWTGFEPWSPPTRFPIRAPPLLPVQYFLVLPCLCAHFSRIGRRVRHVDGVPSLVKKHKKTEVGGRAKEWKRPGRRSGQGNMVGKAMGKQVGKNGKGGEEVRR